MRRVRKEDKTRFIIWLIAYTIVRLLSEHDVIWQKPSVSAVFVLDSTIDNHLCEYYIEGNHNTMANVNTFKYGSRSTRDYSF
jgi:hypothetical protein